MSDVYREIVKLRQQGRKGALATIIQVQGSIPSYESSKILVRDDGSIVGTVGGGCVEADVWAAAQDVMREEKPRRLHFNLNSKPEYDTGLVCGGSLDIFIEPILSTPSLFLFGAGHVSLSFPKWPRLPALKPLFRMTARPSPTPSAFPRPATHAGPWEQVFRQLSFNELSYIVIATRGHKGDLACLREALQDSGALHRHDRQQAEDHRIRQGARKRRGRARAARTGSLARGPRHRGAHAPGNRGLGRCGNDCRAPQRRRSRPLAQLPVQSSANLMSAHPASGVVPKPRSVAGLILAAGESSRMGTDKALLVSRPHVS